MKPKTEELLGLMLWSCDRLMHPTWRNLTDSYECWAYRKGFLRQIRYLENLDLLESQTRRPDERTHRLTETGRLHALGGRDPEACWERAWDQRWRLVLFDVPLGQDAARNRLRGHLRGRGFGCLQKSVWISPHPLTEERLVLAHSKVDAAALLFLEARPAAGETDAEIVAGAWDFPAINQHYARYLQHLSMVPSASPEKTAAASAFRQWAGQERLAWLKAVSLDPLLPEVLLPAGYLGRHAWQARRQLQAHVACQLASLSI